MKKNRHTWINAAAVLWIVGILMLAWLIATEGEEAKTIPLENNIKGVDADFVQVKRIDAPEGSRVKLAKFEQILERAPEDGVVYIRWSKKEGVLGTGLHVERIFYFLEKMPYMSIQKNTTWKNQYQDTATTMKMFICSMKLLTHPGLRLSFILS